MLIPLESGFVNLTLGMTDGSSKFSKRQFDQLDTIAPAIEALVCKHWRDTPMAPAETALRERLHSALGAFGSSVLTRREQQVIELVLLGHSTRLVAEKLGISAETVKASSQVRLRQTRYLLAGRIVLPICRCFGEPYGAWH